MRDAVEQINGKRIPKKNFTAPNIRRKQIAMDGDRNKENPD